MDARVAATLAVGLVVLAAGVAATLARTTTQRTGTNVVGAITTAGPLVGGGEICQRGERIPAGTGAVRVTLRQGSPAQPPPSARATIASASATVARSGGTATWEDEALVAPVRPVLRRAVHGEVCIAITDARGTAATMMVGTQSTTASARLGATALPLRLRIEYLLPTEQTWWSFLPTIAQRIGFGHPWSGRSVAVAFALLSLTSISLAAWQLTRGTP